VLTPDPQLKSENLIVFGWQSRCRFQRHRSP
jgi:hypothetical protein